MYLPTLATNSTSCVHEAQSTGDVTLVEERLWTAVVFRNTENYRKPTLLISTDCSCTTQLRSQEGLRTGAVLLREKTPSSIVKLAYS